MYLKEWRERPISIGEFENLWEQNNKLEVAKALLGLLKDAKAVSKKEKVIFLNELIEDHNLGEAAELKYLAVKFFLEIVPVWDNEFGEECKNILSFLSHIWEDERKGWENKIKIFLHSVLNGKKKAETDYYMSKILGQALIRNRMLEELVNYYDILSPEAMREILPELWEFVFDWRTYNRSNFNVLLCGKGEEVERARKCVVEALFSWDKVKNRHALATLWTLLAKRGDLNKIFGTKKTEEIKKAE